jgi:VWFA-related protein
MREITKRGVVTAAVLALAGASLAVRAQQTPQETFRSGVDIVRLDVSVLDKNRRPVRNLTAADFTVLEGGDAQPIVAFSAVDVPGPPDHSASWMRDVGPDIASNRLDSRRIIAIVMDDCNTELGDASVARSIARNVVDRLGPDDFSGVVFVFTGRSQNFTTDHRQLLTAVDSFIPKRSPPPRRGSAAAGNTPVPRGGGSPLACQLGSNVSRTLMQVATALKDTPDGRKAIVLISPGIPWNFSLDWLEEAEDGDDAREAFRALQRANVNVYTFDPSGVSMDGIMAPRLDALRLFAENTGGRAVFATNAPEAHVEQVFVENGSYYLLGIAARDASEGSEFRKLTVKVNRPGVEVRTRPGYFVERTRKASPARAAVPVTALEKAFGNALPTGDLPLSVSVAPFGLPGSRQAVLAVTIGTARPASDRVRTETIELRTTAFEYEWYEKGVTSTQTLELTARPNAAGERRFEVPTRLTVKAGRYEVRVGAESSTGAAGGVFVGADVPDFSKAPLALSGLVLGFPRRAPSGVSDVLADLIPIAPTVQREFAAAEPIQAFVRVYQGGAKTPVAAAVAARIVDSTNREVFGETTVLARERFGANKTADYQLGLVRMSLGAGAYLLSIEVKAANTTVRREVRFTVKSTAGSTGPSRL